MKTAYTEDDLTSTVVDILLKIGALVLVLIWCFQIISPFLNIVVWAIIIAITLYPLQNMISTKLGERPKLASALIFGTLLATVLIPSYFFGESLVEGIQNYTQAFEKDAFDIPAPPAKVAEIPIVGDKLYATWHQASENVGDVLLKYKDQLGNIGKAILNGIMGTAGGILQLVVSFIIAGIMLSSSKNVSDVGTQFYRRLIGKERGDEFATVSEITIRNVAKGILGVSAIQAILIGIVLLLANVPYAGLWTLFCLILCTMQIGPAPIIIPVIIYIFSIYGTGMSIFWTVILVALTLLDNVLKPMLMGKGAPVPMLVIFIGSLGGFFTSGFLGMFIGAIVLSIGYKLFIAWLNDAPEKV